MPAPLPPHSHFPFHHLHSEKSSHPFDSLEWYRSLIEHIPGVIYSASLEKGMYALHYVSPQIESLLGIPPSTWMENSTQFLRLVLPDDWNAVITTLEDATSSGTPYEIDYRMKTLEGETVWIRDRGVCLRSQSGDAPRFQGLWVDITHHKHLEEELSHWDRELRQLTDHIPDILGRFSRQGHLVYLNHWFDSTAPLPPETYLGKTFADMGLPDDIAKKLEEALQQVSLDRQTVTVEFTLPHHPMVRQYEMRMIPELDLDQRVNTILCVTRDVTEHKQIEQEHIMQSKLDSLGIFAGGLAHDFNNSLTSILGQLALAQMTLSPESPLHQRLKEVESASLRAQGLTQQLLTFAKGGLPVKQTVNLQPVIKDNTVFSLTGSNIDCHFDLPSDLWTVEADVGQVSQVIQNLVINARQAMPEGGTLTIRVRNVSTPSHTDAQYSCLQPGSWVTVSIEDKGIGIPSDLLKKIFDPYFTTKSTGNGLGLASSYSIMRKHGGHILVTSVVGQGTTFTLCFPATPQESPSHTSVEIGVRKGSGKVLLLDDDEYIRLMTGEMLELCGYTPVLVKTGAEAVEAFKEAHQSGHPFHAVILDLVVRGGMGGKEVIQRLRQIDPKVKALVISGYSNDPILAKFREYGFTGRLPKPFRLQELSQELQAVMETHPPA